MAFAYDMPMILITLGFIFIIETLSDIIQVTYFKLTHGKRACSNGSVPSPSWDGRLDGKVERKELFVLFTGISLAMAIISFIGVYQRFA